MPFSLGLLPAGEKNEGRANVMDKIAAQTWFSCSIYYSRSEVLYEILGNVKSSEFVRPKQALHISPTSTQNSAVFSTWTWSSSKNWPQEWRSLLLAGNLTPVPHPNPVSYGWPGEQLLWREDVSSQVLQEELFGFQVVLVPVPTSPAVRTVWANSLDHLETPWAGWSCHEHQAPAGATALHRSSQWALCRAAGCRQALWQCRRESLSPSTLWILFPLCPNAPRNRALLPPSRQVLSPATLLFFGCYFRRVAIHWCSS